MKANNFATAHYLDQILICDFDIHEHCFHVLTEHNTEDCMNCTKAVHSQFVNIWLNLNISDNRQTASNISSMLPCATVVEHK